jgi:phage baseplate assembly protein gpV
MSALKCTVTLDKTQGLVLLVEDEAKGSKQTVTLLKDTIILKVEGSAGTTTVTQNAESVAIKCKKFSVEADDSECRSQQASTYAAKTVLSLSGETEAKLSGKKTQCSGTTVSFEAKGQLTAEANGVATVKGSIVKLSSPQVTLG